MVFHFPRSYILSEVICTRRMILATWQTMELQALIPTCKNEVENNTVPEINLWEALKPLKFLQLPNRVPIKEKTHKKHRNFFFLHPCATLSLEEHSLNCWEEDIQLPAYPSKWKERSRTSLQCLACLGLRKGFISVLPDLEPRQEWKQCLDIRLEMLKVGEGIPAGEVMQGNWRPKGVWE